MGRTWSRNNGSFTGLCLVFHSRLFTCCQFGRTAAMSERLPFPTLSSGQQSISRSMLASRQILLTWLSTVHRPLYINICMDFTSFLFLYFYFSFFIAISAQKWYTYSAYLVKFCSTTTIFICIKIDNILILLISRSTLLSCHKNCPRVSKFATDFLYSDQSISV